jgi:8-hydroxy-5-deazaflavin:NADPH oxidoreductase
MRVTIIGAGNMGRGIGTRALAGGHEVAIVDNDPAEGKALADELGGHVRSRGAREGPSLGNASRQGVQHDLCDDTGRR